MTLRASHGDFGAKVMTKASLEYIQYCIMGKMVLMKEENSFQMFAYEGKEKDKAVA